jgi:Tol biopolymer transport system component
LEVLVRIAEEPRNEIAKVANFNLKLEGEKVKSLQFAMVSLLTLAAITCTLGCGSSSNPANPVYKQMAFWSDRATSDAGGMWAMNVDGSSATIVPFTQTEVYGPSMSADGSSIAFEANSKFWVSNLSGSTQTQLPMTGSEAYVARISPDGKHIVASERVNNQYNLFVTNPDGSSPVNLTATFPSGMTDCYSASFSADTKKIVFQCEGNSLYGLYTINLDGTGLTTVYTNPAFYMDTPAFSPDGKTIFFIKCEGTYTVNSIPTAGGDPTVLITAPNSIYELQVFNSNIYYTLEDGSVNKYRIFKANLDGTSSTPITDGTANNWLYNYTY